MIAFSFQVPGRPVTWQRGVRGLRYDSRGDKAREYRQRVGLFATQALARARRAGLVWPDTKSNAPHFRVDVAGWWPDRVEGDEDRLVSLVRDALEGVAYKSDRQVKASTNAIGGTCEPGADGIVVIVRLLDARTRSDLARAIRDEAEVVSRSPAP